MVVITEPKHETGIEWTHFPGYIGATWNPIAGCSKCATGCAFCYAILQAHRMAGNPNPKISERYKGLTVIQNGRPNWTGVVRLVPDVLEKPLRTRKPHCYFISLSDLFHEDLPDSAIDQVFAVAAITLQHRYVFLTKRGKRMREWADAAMPDRIDFAIEQMELEQRDEFQWPLPNVILGISGSTQEDIDRQVPELLRTPAACRMLSLEPQIEDMDLARYLQPYWTPESGADRPPWLDWVVQGGESGAGARPLDLAWARRTRDQCRAAGVPHFLKQLGAFPCDEREVGTAKGGCHVLLELNDRKGSDNAEWPADLQNCRQFPHIGNRGRIRK